MNRRSFLGFLGLAVAAPAAAVKVLESAAQPQWRQRLVTMPLMFTPSRNYAVVNLFDHGQTTTDDLVDALRYASQRVTAEAKGVPYRVIVKGDYSRTRRITHRWSLKEALS